MVGVSAVRLLGFGEYAVMTLGFGEELTGELPSGIFNVASIPSLAWVRP